MMLRAVADDYIDLHAAYERRLGELFEELRDTQDVNSDGVVDFVEMHAMQEAILPNADQPQVGTWHTAVSTRG